MTMLTLAAHILRSAVTAPGIHIDFLWMLVILFGSVGIAYLILTFVLKRQLTRKEKKTIVLKKDIAPLLSALLYNANDGSREEGEDVMNAKVHIKELLKNPAHRKKISEILIDIRADLPHETRLRILRMYQDFGLHEDAIDRLQSWRWEEVCRGINELTQMQVTGAYMYIRRYINDSRSIVRKQAQLAMVALKREGIVYFLDHAKHAISEWQQLKILETLQELPGYNPPRFRLWLTSKNQHVVLFAMRLIRSFDQDDAMESILKLVKHRDDAIKVEAINCIKEFEYKEAVPLFKRIFRNCKSEVKVALLSAIGEMGEKKDIPFLQFVEQHATDHVIKSKAISTINALAPETILPSDQINESLAEDLLILDIGPIEKLDPGKDDVPSDERHERFQNALKASGFSKYQEPIDEDSLSFDWASEERLHDIIVVAETLEDHMKIEWVNDDKDSIHSILDPFELCTIQGHAEGVEESTQGSNTLVSRPMNNSYDQNEARIVSSEKEREGPCDSKETSTNRTWDQSDPSEHTPISPDFNIARMSYGEESGKITQLPDWDSKGHQGLAETRDCSDLEKIFKHLSEDMKLSLLGDILKLGDTRDLGFLRRLGQDRSARVRRTAKQTYEMLVLRERQNIFEGESEVMPVLNGPTLEELAFELDLELSADLELPGDPESDHGPVNGHIEASKEVRQQSEKQSNE